MEPQRYVRICPLHREALREDAVLDHLRCPRSRSVRGHRVHSWGVLDLATGRVLYLTDTDEADGRRRRLRVA